jgi:hypothetical protein
MHVLGTTGLPVSTTQCLTGAVLAIGLFEGAKGVNWRMFIKIFAGWVTASFVMMNGDDDNNKNNNNNDNNDNNYNDNNYNGYSNNNTFSNCCCSTAAYVSTISN